MQIVVAMDSFKGSLTSLQAGNAVAEAAKKLDQSIEVHVCSLADGGEGTVDALYTGLGGTLVELTVSGPLAQPVSVRYCILPGGITAVIEMACAAGLTLVPPERRDPMNTTTYGVGQVIRDAIYRGCRNFIVGIGGSGTNDGGIGMLTALGYAFLDKNGDPIPVCGGGLEMLDSIRTADVLPQLRDCTFRIACDVSNPLCGSNGCSAVFGPQKGASAEMITQMDIWLKKYAEIAKNISDKADADHPGAGAAGGLGFAFLAFTNATLEPGGKIILEETRLAQLIRDADLVVTGEGRLDSQTVMGKAPIAVAQLAKQYGKKVIAFCGCVGEGAEECNRHGIDAYFPIARVSSVLEDALNPERAYNNLKDTAYQVLRLVHLRRENS